MGPNNTNDEFQQQKVDASNIQQADHSRNKSGLINQIANSKSIQSLLGPLYQKDMTNENNVSKVTETQNYTTTQNFDRSELNMIVDRASSEIYQRNYLLDQSENLTVAYMVKMTVQPP